MLGDIGRTNFMHGKNRKMFANAIYSNRIVLSKLRRSTAIWQMLNLR